MKILFVCEGLTSTSILAQPWRHVIEIAVRMKKQGNDVQIISNTIRGSSNRENISEITVHRIKKRFFFDSKQLLEHLNDASVDVINWHGSDTLSSLHFWHVRKELKKSIIWTVHSGPISSSDLKPLTISDKLRLFKFWNNFLNALIPRYFLKKLITINQLKLIITLSERTKTVLECIGPGNKKIEVIRSGVDTEKYHPANSAEILTFRKALGFDENPIMLYFGPLSSFRGADTFILAAQKISKAFPSVNFVILARNYSGREEESRIRRLMLNQSNIRVFSGGAHRDEVIQYLQISDIVALPFKFWPQVECPLTILESMATGKAIVTTSIGAIPELISDGETGFLIDPSDSNGLASTVIRLLNDKNLLSRISGNAFGLSRNYDWELITKQTLEVCERVANNVFSMSSQCSGLKAQVFYAL